MTRIRKGNGRRGHERERDRLTGADVVPVQAEQRPRAPVGAEPRAPRARPAGIRAVPTPLSLSPGGHPPFVILRGGVAAAAERRPRDLTYPRRLGPATVAQDDELGASQDEELGARRTTRVGRRTPTSLICCAQDDEKSPNPSTHQFWPPPNPPPPPDCPPCSLASWLRSSSSSIRGSSGCCWPPPPPP